MNEAIEKLDNQLAWFKYVPENELTESERERVTAAAERFTKLIKKLNQKYND